MLNRRSNGFVIMLAAIFVLTMCNGCFLSMLNWTGGTGKLKSYSYTEYSKKEINAAIQCIYKKYPQFKPPEKYKNSVIHFYSDLSSPESRRFNADTVQFHFYVKTNEGDEILYWTAFAGLEEDWISKPTDLSLRGYKKNEGRMNIHEDFKNERAIKKDPYIKLFETEILPKIKEDLGKGKCD